MKNYVIYGVERRHNTQHKTVLCRHKTPVNIIVPAQNSSVSDFVPGLNANICNALFSSVYLCPTLQRVRKI